MRSIPAELTLFHMEASCDHMNTELFRKNDAGCGAVDENVPVWR
jgi:hypothetical protein